MERNAAEQPRYSVPRPTFDPKVVSFSANTPTSAGASERPYALKRPPSLMAIPGETVRHCKTGYNRGPRSPVRLAMETYCSFNFAECTTNRATVPASDRPSDLTLPRSLTKYNICARNYLTIFARCQVARRVFFFFRCIPAGLPSVVTTLSGPKPVEGGPEVP